jgi:hypothetical protein
VTVESTSGEPTPLTAVAALVSRQSADLSLYAGFLINVLNGALPPEQIIIERESGLKARMRRGEPPVVAVSVQVDDRRYTLRRMHPTGLPTATVSHIVGGVVLSSTPTAMDVWARELAAALQQLSAQHAQTADALSRMLGLDI